MRKTILHTCASFLMLLVTLIVSVHGVFERNHPTPGHLAISSCSVSDTERLSELATSSTTPVHRQNQHDGCENSCVDCPCHTSLAAQRVEISFTPVQFTRAFAEPSLYSPEVVLSTFIPPPYTFV
jgi:hypothetical protein